MILGVGTDIVETKRIRAAIERRGQAFFDKVLGPSERQTALGYGAARQIEYVAGRFAAKEALAKAIGCGLGNLAMRHVDIILVSGQGLQIRAQAPSALADLPASDRVHVSISHEKSIAFATAIWERR
ncbi:MULTISPECIES: holo-ACP synthase [Alicyclobacillus]|uniref:Holo-[acyl-carrier-protein] synthase n=1 Tax=Alicyclobacillus acidoterrestris (strain ATCC 49025 / DSM 3922 / CIP 106132 / NCIMB 13137 / GD3B) TaxID=1356854 RepID=T0BTP3_ALIAG|nr:MULTISPECIES: holo-ACP synthase [Alicyclobacillus]EPZ44169.1 hypothetical protein N007_11640 [Alicyclobacillus acidoterrestris ATCC 49025]UNO49684.1 holo-ACP synthase [Alicyclobacillus acidoterrestris]